MANFATPKICTVKLPVDVKDDGTIAVSGEAKAGVKTLSITGLKAFCTPDQAMTFFNAVHGTIGEYNGDSLQATQHHSAGIE